MFNEDNQLVSSTRTNILTVRGYVNEAGSRVEAKSNSNTNWLEGTVRFISSTQSYFEINGILTTNIYPSSNTVWVRAYDVSNNVSTSVVHTAYSSTIKREYDYDADGNLAEFPAPIQFYMTNVQYSWDAANRLTSMVWRTKPQITNFFLVTTNRTCLKYDGMGRLRQISEYGTNSTPTGVVRFVWNGWTLAGELDGSNRLVKIGYKPRDSVAYLYDTDGNLLEYPVSPLTIQTNFVMSWDAENRLISMQRKYRISSILQTNRSEFVYDSANRLRQVKEYSTNGVLTNTTRYIWSGWQIAGELDGSNRLVRTYTYGVDVSGTIGGAAGIGGLAGIHSYAAPVTNYYTRHDGKGNVTEVRRYNGTTAASYGYYEFGGVRYQTNTYNQPLRFQTKIYHISSGLSCFGYRWYYPQTGSWISRDPIGEEGEPNLYSYCGNNPLFYVDPNGEISQILGVTFLATVAFGYVVKPEMNVSFNPQGQFAATYGFLALYGPEMQDLHPTVQQSIRIHERRHQRQFPVYASSKYGERTAYNNELIFLDQRLGMIAKNIRQRSESSCPGPDNLNQLWAEYRAVKEYRNLILIPTMQDLGIEVLP